MDDSLRGWIMVVLTLLFVGLYGAALLDWLKPLTDDKMVARLEPIIFVIIGYYFGRLPGQQNEKTLKDQIGQKSQEANTSQQDKEQAQRVSAALQEKVRNAKASLASAMPGAPAAGLATTLSKGSGTVPQANLHQAVAAALNVLES